MDTQLFHISAHVITKLTPIQDALKDFLKFIGDKNVELIGNSQVLMIKLIGNLERNYFKHLV